MKMAVAKVCGFLARSVLPFILLVDSTVACIRDLAAEHKAEYCKHEIVIGGSYQGTLNTEPPINTFKITKFVKGPRDMKEVIKINTADKINCKFYPQDVNSVFIVVAERKNGEIVCTRHQASIDSFERSALERIITEGCNPKPVSNHCG